MKNSIEASGRLKRKQGEHPPCSSPGPQTVQAVVRVAVQVETMWILKKIFVFTMVLFLVPLFSTDI
jgi:hypothetical protein